MRLWHQTLIPYLDSKRLVAQHRECCALRGRGWNRKHKTVDYIFNYSLGYLYSYHLMVMHEMTRRNFNVNCSWYNRLYRGEVLGMATISKVGIHVYSVPTIEAVPHGRLKMVYPEHDDNYLRECLLLLKKKGTELTNGKTIDEMLIELDLKHGICEHR